MTKPLKPAIGVFFNDGDGIHIIENCFHAVLQKYKEDDGMVPWFRHYFENELHPDNRFAWPDNARFGNSQKYMQQQYTRNVITNLTTHAKKRLSEFLKMKEFDENWNAPEDDDEFVEFDETDVKNAVVWAMRQYDATTLKKNLRKTNKNMQKVSLNIKHFPRLAAKILMAMHLTYNIYRHLPHISVNFSAIYDFNI